MDSRRGSVVGLPKRPLAIDFLHKNRTISVGKVNILPLPPQLPAKCISVRNSFSKQLDIRAQANISAQP
jgi:hypothetical protein